MKRVLHIVANLSVGGAEVHLFALLTEICRRGEAEVALAYYRERPDDARSLREDFKAAGITLFDLRLQRNPIVAWFRLRGVIQRWRPDIVHSHLSRVTFADIVIGRALGVRRTVVSIHNVESYFSSWFWRLLLRIGVQRASACVAISEAVKRALVTKLGADPEKIAVVHYALDAPAFTANVRSLRSELGVTDTQFLIGTVGRMAEQKGQRYLISAMHEVIARHPQARLLIAGHDTGARMQLERQLRDERLGGVVRLVGYRDDVASLMAAFDLFVLPSLWEGFGLVLIEAMALGRAIVASSVDSVPEIVEDGKTGLLVPPRDSQALAAAINRLIDNPSLRAELGEGGRVCLATRFSMDAMLRGTLDLYRLGATA